MVKGFESEINAYPIDNLAFNASVGYNQFRGDQSDRTAVNFRDSSAILQPEWNFSTGLQYSFGFSNGGKLTPRLDWYYQSYRTNGTAALPQRDPDDRVPGYSLANLRLTYDTPENNWQVAFSVNNLFDTRQEIVDASGSVPLRFQPYLVDPTGRFFEIELRKLF